MHYVFKASNLFDIFDKLHFFIGELKFVDGPFMLLYNPEVK